MSEFSLYFNLGLEHIIDINGFDHILFVVVLSAVYVFREWKSVLVLVTAFTLGHSVTLALSSLNIININTDIVEFLIPVTILLTGISNLFRKDYKTKKNKLQANYLYAVFFGMIHGLGFSNYLKGLLGKDETIITQLLAFNIGLEAGQIIIVVIFLVIAFIFVDLFGVSRRDWKMVVSSAIAGISLMLMLETKFW